MAVERLSPASKDYIELLFHWHRYLAVADLCRGRVVLDVACGDGYGTHYLAQQAQRVVGVDVDAKTILEAQEKYTAPNLQFVQGSASSLPFPDASLDVVVSFETIEHLDEAAQHSFIKEVQRVLKPSGVFLVSTPDRTRTEQFVSHNPYHVRELTRTEFKDLLGEYFQYIDEYFQEVNLVSYIWPCHKNASHVRSLAIETSEDGSKPTTDPLSLHMYMIAVCTNQPASPEWLIGSFCQDITRRPIEDLWHRNTLLETQRRMTDELLRQSEENLRKREEEAIALRNQNRLLSGELLALEKETAALRDQNRLLSDELLALREQVSEFEIVTHSRSWKLVQAYWRAMDKPMWRVLLSPLRALVLFIFKGDRS